MANPKRASMREGPLAALFRKTEEDEGETPRAPAPQEPPKGGKARRAAEPQPPAHPPVRPAVSPDLRLAVAAVLERHCVDAHAAVPAVQKPRFPPPFGG